MESLEDLAEKEISGLKIKRSRETIRLEEKSGIYSLKDPIGEKDLEKAKNI